MNLETLCECLNKNQVKYALVGGHAVALHGAVRGTVDFDFILQWNLKNLKKAEQALNELGLVSRHPIGAEDVFHFRREYIEKRNLVAWNFYHPRNPAIRVDIVLTFDLNGCTKKDISFRGIQIIVIGIDDLIEMKVAAGRAQDLEDIKALRRIKNEN